MFIKIINMKKIIQHTLILLILLPAISFAQNKKASWPAMKKFHSYMASTFHPAEEGNLSPLKAKADSLFISAKEWQQSAIPANFKPAETKAGLINLVNKCEAVQQAVTAKLADEQLKKLIAEAHDIFHHIVGECQKADE